VSGISVQHNLIHDTQGMEGTVN